MPVSPALDPEISSWTILVIDDAPDNITVAKTVFTHFGAKVFEASDGLQGLAMLRQVNPSIVLLDISMPVMNGWEMLKNIRQTPEFQNVVVIAVTAHAMKGDREKALEAGFDGYIAKPFQIMELVKQVKIIMASRKAKKI